MFTLEQIKAAHAKVKSGADFPAYIQELKALGIQQYETFVVDGHTDFQGANDFKIKAPAKFTALNIAEESKRDSFKTDLKAHQAGKTDFLRFCNDAANSGVEKWVVTLKDMLCTYYDKSGHVLLVEEIPEA